MEPTSKRLNKSAWSWALYDWANSAFATTVMAGFFPIFFKSYWASDLSDAESTFAIGSVNSLVGLLIAFSAPILGALADAGDSKRKFLFSFAFLGILATGYLFFIPESSWKFAVIFYGIGVIGFSGGNIFYDSLLVAVSKEKERNRVSALGFSLGYLGGGILFLINVFMFLYPNRFGLENEIEAVLCSFLSVAVWWLVFSLPIYLNVKEPIQNLIKKQFKVIITDAFGNLLNTARSIKKFKSAVIFLLAYFLYMDGVDTIIRMATSYGSDIGLSATSMIQALLLTQFIGFPATLVFGYYADQFGYKLSLSFAHENSDQKTFTIKIRNGSSKYIFRYTKSGVEFCIREYDTQETFQYAEVFQSEITYKIIEALLSSRCCELPNYQAAASAHIVLIEALLGHMNGPMNCKTNICPIT